MANPAPVICRVTGQQVNSERLSLARLIYGQHDTAAPAPAGIADHGVISTLMLCQALDVSLATFITPPLNVQPVWRIAREPTATQSHKLLV